MMFHLNPVGVNLAVKVCLFLFKQCLTGKTGTFSGKVENCLTIFPVALPVALAVEALVKLIRIQLHRITEIHVDRYVFGKSDTVMIAMVAVLTDPSIGRDPNVNVLP